MLTKFKLDAEIDIATSGELAQAIDSTREPQPLRFPKVGSNSASNGGNTIIDLGAPPTGKIWNILTVTLCGSDDHTAVTGSASLYVDSEVNQGNLGLANLRMPALAIPSFTSISNRTMWAHGNGNVVVNVTGTSGNPIVNCILGIAEYWEVDVGPRSTQ